MGRYISKSLRLQIIKLNFRKQLYSGNEIAGISGTYSRYRGQYTTFNQLTYGLYIGRTGVERGTLRNPPPVQAQITRVNNPCAY